jgi:hypothetical protein
MRLGRTPLQPTQAFVKPRHKAEQIRAELQKGTGILKAARLCGTGVSVVQRDQARDRVNTRLIEGAKI